MVTFFFCHGWIPLMRILCYILATFNDFLNTYDGTLFMQFQILWCYIIESCILEQLLGMTLLVIQWAGIDYIVMVQWDRCNCSVYIGSTGVAICLLTLAKNSFIALALLDHLLQMVFPLFQRIYVEYVAFSSHHLYFFASH